ncbi:Protein IQ-DOMAIN 32 [Dichanthelium oligosanthes]|uniref:Protein IQ-DOMAIN 32 n=1 Tax=Dichanthelium oligosanthes TaxID=888268 RepID=A0A1E5VYM7_9POAL|nr:Protein IQ-DOMAIN 32 [Dichanthelium oligosanthes]
MARSKNGCLKILVCAGSGSDPSAGSDADADDHPDENKAISDKSRWSFRRRSTRHRILKNSDISEPETLSSSKAKADITPSNNVYTSTYSYASEKPLHQDKPDEKILHEEKPEEKPLHQEVSDEKLEKPIEKPVDKLMEEPTDQIIEKSIELPVEKTTETPTEEPAEKITDAPTEVPVEKTGVAESEDPAEKIMENPIEETPERAIEELIEKPTESISVSSAEPEQEETASLVEGSGADPDEEHLESEATDLQPGSGTCIARQELPNQKDLVKLQAVIRGRLVRKQASESLHCLLAIVKIQGLIRARQAQQSGGKVQETIVHSSGEKLLQNGFALKLMDSMPTPKSIHIKCDPSESDITWKWMERWTSLIPPITGEHLPEHIENGELMGANVKEDAQHDDKIVPLDSDLSFPKLVHDDVKETLGTSDSRALDVPASIPDESSEVEIKRDPESELIENTDIDAEQVTDQKTENAVDEFLMPSDQQSTQADASSEPIPLPEKPESSNEDSGDAYNSEQTLEMEDKKAVARKSCNPAFAAAQLKFEELSTNSTVSRSSSSSYLDGASKSRAHTPRSQEDYSSKQDNDMGLPESSVGHDAKMIIAASECGTEISISSTLDSPDRSEGDGGEIVLEIGALENRNYVSDKANKDDSIVHSEVKNAPEVEAQPQKEEQQNGHASDPEIEAQPQEVLVQEPHVEPEESDLHDHLEKPVESYATPEGTPMSRATFPESHGTPSSEVSVNTKKGRSKKPKSHASKRSLASPSSDSVGRSSTDNFSKESRRAKRENPSKAAKSDNVDQEPRISNSNPLPSYMQFTESARAKASANASPKMSPDVQDSNPRKRHSLPMTNGKHDLSPRMQRSSSQAQAQQNVKTNGAVPQNSSGKCFVLSYPFVLSDQFSTLSFYLLTSCLLKLSSSIHFIATL